MSTVTEESAVLSEATWNAWIEKGKGQQRATARKAKMALGILAVLLAIAAGFYLIAGK
jgi:hypothetical protein